MSDTLHKSISARSTPEEVRARIGVRSASRGLPRPWSTRIVEGIKTFLWVAPLTVLIWVYAEREQQAELTEVPVPIEVRASSPDRIVTLLSDDDTVHLDLLGPRARLNSVRDTFADPHAQPVVITIGDEVSPGTEDNILVAERLSKDHHFTDNAISITRSRPAAIRVRVDRKLTEQVPVKVNPNTKIVGDPPVFDPPTVAVSGPAPELERIKKLSGGPLVVYADLAPLANKPPGQYKLETVDLTFPYASKNISYPKTVKASVNLLPSARVSLKAIPIEIRFIAGALPELDAHKITLTPATLANVDIVGTPDAIALIKTDDDRYRPRAILYLTPEDLARLGDNTKRLGPTDYALIPGVKVENPAKDISYTISLRGG